MNRYPVQIQADNWDASSAFAKCMCHVFDKDGEVTVFNALAKVYLHVVAWDASGELVGTYDNR